MGESEAIALAVDLKIEMLLMDAGQQLPNELLNDWSGLSTVILRKGPSRQNRPHFLRGRGELTFQKPPLPT